MNLEIRYSPPNQSQQVVPVRDRLMIGSLLSNEVVIRATAVEPIHAMIEVLENGVHMLTDLGSHSGVFLNGKRIEVESPLSVGDRITIGDVVIEVMNHQTAAAASSEFKAAQNEGTRVGGEATVMNGRSGMAASPPPASVYEAASDHDMESDHEDADEADDMAAGDDVKTTVRAAPRGDGDRGSDDGGDQLFSPRNAKPSGNVLEVVSYWDETIVDVDLFHPKFKNFEKVTIGESPKAHFLSGSDSDVRIHELASVNEEGYTLHLMPDMQARLRKGGKVLEESGGKSINMSKHDIAHISQGPLKYFLMFIKPPVLELPRNSARDPVFAAIMLASILFYVAAIPAIYLSKNPKDDMNDDDIWSIVNAPEKKEEPKPVPKEKKVEVAEVKQEPPPKPTPPKPPPKPPTPVPPEAKPKPVEQVKQPTPTPPVEKPTQQLAEPKKPTPPTPQPPQEKPKDQGMAQAGKKPDFKQPGAVTAAKVGPSGGAQGGDKLRPDAGGQRKGEQKVDLAGAEGGAPNKASGVNLAKLGLGAGKVLSQVGAGAIKTDFKDSAGGAGGGAGSGAKTLGLGGPGTGKTLGVAGTGGAANNFGGFGGTGSGEGGAGGLGGAGIGKGFGKGEGGAGRANVEVPPGDPVVAGGLTTQEVQAVIRANLNQIRHCYEQLLQRSPNANGKIKVNFVIGSDGRVTSSNIASDTVGDAVMAGCVTGKIVRWKFPTPRGGQNVNVNYPFVFNPL